MNTTPLAIDEAYLIETYQSRGGGGRVNVPSEFERVTEDIQRSLLAWIQTYMTPAKRFDQHNTSYGLKHKFEDDTGHYVCNGAFKGAMLHSGFRPKDVREINWHFNARFSWEWLKQARAKGPRPGGLLSARD